MKKIIVMLDYKALETQFTEVLQSFSKEDLETWIAFDEHRKMMEALVHGEVVNIFFDDFRVKKLYHWQETKFFQFNNLPLILQA